MAGAQARQIGSIGILALALVGVAMALTLLVADVSMYMLARANAQVAADSAALAAAPVTFRPFGAAGSPAEEAARFAAANGASLVECRCATDTSWRTRTVYVRVVVGVDLFLVPERAVHAASSAQFTPTRLHG